MKRKKIKKGNIKKRKKISKKIPKKLDKKNLKKLETPIRNETSKVENATLKCKLKMKI